MANASLQASKSIAPGICRKGTGYRVRAKYQRKVAEKRFAADTPLKVMLDWQLRARATLISDLLVLSPKAIPLLPKAPDGWCYLYVFRSGGHVKIGRTVDPRARLQQLQTLQPEPVDFVVAVPIHASFEPVVHQYFLPVRTQGEWYVLSDEVVAFVEWLQAGKNPLQWFWDVAVHAQTRRPSAPNGPVMPCRDRTEGTMPLLPAVP